MDPTKGWPTPWVGWWIAPDDKSVLIEIRRRRILVSVAPSRDAKPYESAKLLDRSTKGIRRLPATPLTDEEGRRYLEVEAGTPELGPTYRLYSAIERAPGDLAPALDTAEVADVILVPNISMGLYDDYEDDLGVPWALPLEPLRWVADS